MRSNKEKGYAPIESECGMPYVALVEKLDGGFVSAAVAIGMKDGKFRAECRIARFLFGTPAGITLDLLAAKGETVTDAVIRLSDMGRFWKDQPLFASGLMRAVAEARDDLL